MKQACERCGAFAPVALVARRELCEACHGRLVVARGRPNVSELLASTWKLLQRVGLKSALVLGVAAIPQAILGLWEPTVPLLGPMVLAGFVTFFATIVVMDMSLQAVTDSGEPDLVSAARTARRRFFGYFGLQILVSFEVALWSLACVLPGIARMVRLVHAGATYLGDDCSVFEARRRAIDTSMGSWADLFVGMLVVYLPVFGLGMAGAAAGMLSEYDPELYLLSKVIGLVLAFGSSLFGVLIAVYSVAVYVGISPRPEWAKPEPIDGSAVIDPSRAGPALDSPL